MAGKLTVQGFQQALLGSKVNIMLDGVHVSSVSSNQSVDIPITKNCVMSYKCGINPSKGTLQIEDGMHTIVQLKYNQLTGKITTNVVNKEPFTGKLDIFDENNFYGVIINSAEVGTNLLGWVRGVDLTSSTTPVSARFTFTNKTGKEIKYLTLGIRPYNAVGDPVECTVQGISLYDCKCTGPFAPNEKSTHTLEHAWYNTNIASVKIESAEIIYMDNSTETLTPEQIKCLAKDTILSDNDSRIVRNGFGQTLMIIAGIIDVISIFGIFTMDSGIFSVLTTISTIAFFIGLKMKTN